MTQATKSITQFATAVALILLLGAGAWLATAVAVFCVAVAAPAPWRPAVPLRSLAAYGVWLLIWVIFAASYLRVMSALGYAVEPQPPLVELARQGGSTPQFWPLLLMIVVAAPLVEEIIFRGYLLTSIRSAAPRWAAHLVVATLFGLAHGLGHALPIGVLSLVFGYLREKHGSLLPSVLAHACHNGIMVTVSLTWPELLDLFYAR